MVIQLVAGKGLGHLCLLRAPGDSTVESGLGGPGIKYHLA